jgi:hypothetical protein
MTGVIHNPLAMCLQYGFPEGATELLQYGAQLNVPEGSDPTGEFSEKILVNTDSL